MRLIDADAFKAKLAEEEITFPLIDEQPTVNPWEVVYDELTKISLFCGRYDAEHAADRYMYGIATVMEHIAYHAGKQDEFNE